MLDALYRLPAGIGHGRHRHGEAGQSKGQGKGTKGRFHLFSTNAGRTSPGFA
jgi:hypothetical protein